MLQRPLLLESDDDVGAQYDSRRPHEGLECLQEVPGRDPFEVEPGDQLLNALGPSQVRRQDLRGEGQTL